MKDSSIIQRSLVILKPDAIQRGIVGELISRFERKGLKMAAMKIVQPTAEMARKHYDKDDAWCEEIGGFIRNTFKEQELDFTWDSDLEAGREALQTLIDYLSCGPVVVMVLEGGLAIKHIRNMVGFRDPIDADMGTIRADYTIESAYMANTLGRSVRNMVHASGAPDEAETEIALWFTEDEICNYELAIEKVLYDPEWERERREING
jgi:nucleoside-diphosphate kinase